MRTFDDRFRIGSRADLEEAVEEFGFLPYFCNSVPGFSIEEHAAPKIWFTDEPGAWEWKGPVIRGTGCAYGKFFENKAVYVSREWFPDFANLRRDGYDYDARVDDELVSYREMTLYNLVNENAPIISRDLKFKGNYKKGGAKGFDTLITRLQAQCYVVISDFIYQTDRHGRPYGWGVAEYSTPERMMGRDFTDRVYERTPEESRERVLSHLRKILPRTDEKTLRRILG